MRLWAWLLGWVARLDWCGGCGDPDCEDCVGEWS
jgi:hypothetical protein